MKSIAQAFRNGLRLSLRAARFGMREPATAFLLMRMAAWVIILTLLVKLFPLGRVIALMTPERVRRRGLAPESTQERLARLLDMLLATDFWIFTPTCWKRAPVLYRYLALNGIRSRVVFGVRKGNEGSLDGHAWLEAEGHPLLEATSPNYRETFSFPV
ncbi:MAG: lasso peptide biosynthesis B2 protein [Pyrinomonadaceae bacterium]